MATDKNMDFPSLACRKTEGACQDPSEPTTVPMAPRDLQPDPVPHCACPVGKQDGKLAWLFPAPLAAQGSNICYCCPLTPYPSSTSLNCVFCNHFTVREKLRPKAQWLGRKGFGPVGDVSFLFPPPAMGSFGVCRNGRVGTVFATQP